MNCIIPFTKDIKFNTNIAKILSISLEHEYTANTKEILGNFIVSGDYKTHEVSINKEHFEHVLPFSVNTTAKIDTDSVDFAIENFTYEVVDKNILRVNIEYSINALEVPLKEEILETVEPPSLDSLLDEIDRINEIDNVETLEESENLKEEPKEEKEVKEENVPDKNDSNKEDNKEERNIDSEKEILNNVTDEDTYVTYNIHIVKEVDTIESICIKYNINQSMLEEYNDLSNLVLGQKLIIPEFDE